MKTKKPQMDADGRRWEGGGDPGAPAWSIIRGDCIEAMKRMPEKSVDFVFTDPPYGHNNNDGDLIANREKALGRSTEKQEARPIAGDGEEATPILHLALLQIRRLLRGGGCCCCCCCCGGGGPDPQFARWALLLDGVLDFVQMVIWDKGPMGLGWKYRRSYETILVSMKRGGKMRWHDDSHRIENVIRPGGAIRKIIPRARQHPTEKPVELAEHFIRLHTQPGDVVLDPFCGAGTTGQAAIRLGRRFIGIELDSKWARVARQRLAASPHPRPSASICG